MQTLGQRLRDEREKKGLSIPELATRTRIRTQLFEAIEADKPDLFPGRFFYRSFLRQYADILELPESAVRPEIDRSIAAEQAENVEREALAKGFKPEVPPLPTGRRINVREETRRWMIRLSGLLGVLVLCSGVYFFWERWGQRWFDDTWRIVVASPAHPAPKPKPSAPPASPAAAVPVVAEPPAAVSTAPPTPPEATAQQPANQPDLKLDSPRPNVLSSRKIEFRASGLCWVGGWRDGKQFLAKVMRAGDVQAVDGSGAVRLQFGSSGDVVVTVDGHTLPPIGAKGEPRILEYQDGAYRLLNRISSSPTKP